MTTSTSGAPAAPPNPKTLTAGAPAASALAVPTAGRQVGPRPIGITAARKQRGYLGVALVGPSGSGKTYDALLLARGFLEELGLTADRRGPGVEWWNYDAAQGGEPAGPARVLVADTEAGSAVDYDHLYPFDVCEIEPPYTIERYRAAYDQAVAGGYTVLVIDSGTHLWAGDGGILSEKDAMVRGGSRSGFDDWAKLTPKWEAFKSGVITQRKLHLIVTFRTKTDYDKDPATGKRVKVGLKPIARDEIEYEFTTVLEIDHAHQASNDKDRTGLFANGAPFVPTVETGRALMKWRMSGAEPGARAVVSAMTAKAPVSPAPAVNGAPGTQAAYDGPPTVAQRDEVKALRTELGISLEDAKDGCGLGRATPVTTAQQAAQLIEYLKAVKIANNGGAGSEAEM